MMSEAAPSGAVPADANEHCPGTAAEDAGRANACAGCPNQAACASAPKGPDPDVAAIAARLAGVKHKILVLSGKGGVGKSTVAAQLAFALAASGREVGLLDIDICGPSMPKMLGLEGHEVHQSAAGWSPVYVEDNLGVMSIGFLLPDPDEAVVWRGPRKNGLIKQFLRDVDWGQMDYLIVDAPPGTSDEHISIAQLLGPAGCDGAVVVTTPQEVALIDVRKELSFCKKVGMRVLGVVENMAGLQTPLASLRFLRPRESGAASVPGADASANGSAFSEDEEPDDVTAEVQAELARLAPHLLGLLACADVFAGTAGGGAQRMAAAAGVPFLGRIPLDPGMGLAAEQGRSALELGRLSAPAAAALRRIVGRVEAAVGERPGGPA